MIRSFAKEELEPQALHYNREEKFNIDLFRQLGTITTTTDGRGGGGLGILGLTVPEQYGGTEMDATAVAIVHEELSYVDPAFCLSYLAHTLLLVNNLAVNANEEQCRLYLPRLCDGSQIGGMCMSEPSAGTDVLGMKTNAKQELDGENGDWILNGQKLWITNAYTNNDTNDTGDVFLVYAKTGPGRSDITQFLVTKGMDGFTLGQRIKDKLGMRASNTGELVFDHVRIPHANVVGAPHKAALCMMRNLEIERIGLASMALGIARRSIDEMKSYAGQRSAFGKPDLYGFGQIQHHVAESYANYMAGRCYVYSLANTLKLDTYGNGLNADATKLYCAPMAKQVADRAIQVMGGYGYVGEYTVERLWRDAKLLEIGGGTNESHHKNMARDLKRMGSTPLE
jgi:isovaleryl-CoA dehydrogenase